MRHADLYQPVVDGADDEAASDLAKEIARAHERRENELLWAHYRDRDITQREAASAAITDRSKVPGQSQASRIYRRIDREILYHSAILGEYKDEVDDGHTNNPITNLGEKAARSLSEEYTEALKDWIARLILEHEATSALTDTETSPAPWMDEYIPDGIREELTELRTEHYLTAKYTETVTPADDIQEELDRREESPDGEGA